MADGNARVLLGHITGAHGVSGEVRIRAYTEKPEAIAAYGPLHDETGGRRFTIVRTRPVKDGVIARLDGVDDRETAEALKGTALYVPRGALPDEAEDDTEDGDTEAFYQVDLIGLVAIGAAGAALGQVVAVQNFGGGDLLEVRPSAGGETVLVPFTEAIVPEIDIEGGWMLMLPPEGLFED